MTTLSTIRYVCGGVILGCALLDLGLWAGLAVNDGIVFEIVAALAAGIVLAILKRR